MYQIVLILLVLFSYLLYKYSTRTFDVWNKLGVVYIKPFPFFGNLPVNNKSSFIVYLRKIYDMYPDNDYVGMWLMQRPTLMIRSPDLVKRILSKDFDYFCNRLAASGNHDPWGQYNLFTCDDLGTRYALDTVAACSFGIESNSIENPDSELQQMVKMMTNTNPIFRRLELMVTLYMPQLSPFLRTYVFTKKASHYFTKLFTSAEKQRKLMNDKTIEYFLDVLAKCRGSVVSNGQVLTDEIITAQGIIFLFAGVETTATLIAFTLLELSHRADVQERLFEEIDAAFKENGKLDYEAAQKLPLLEQCLKETLRKHPIVSSLDRRCMKDYKIDDNLTIPKGTAVLINVAGIHYDRKYYPNPTVWEPERFSNENNITPFSFLPLGEGPRNCIGARFGMLSAKTVVAKILSTYELKNDPRTPHPNDLEYSANDALTHPISPLHVQFIKRNVEA